MEEGVKHMNNAYPFDLEPLRAIENPNERYAAIEQVLDAAKLSISDRVAAILKRKGYVYSTVSAECDVDNGLFSRYMNKGFSCAPPVIYKLCYQFLNMSMQELIFGENRVVELPRDLSSLMRHLNDAKSNVKNEISNNIKRIYERDQAEGALRKIGSPTAIFRSRLIEYAGDRCLREDDLFDRPVKMHLRTAIKKVLATSDELYTGKFLTAVAMAFEMDTTLDYLYAPDYTIYNALGYREDNGDLVVVDDVRLTRTVSRYLNLSDESRQEFLDATWSSILETM